MAKNNDQWRKTMAKNNDDRSESSQGGGSPTKLLVLILCIILAFHLTQQMQSIGLYADMDQFSSSYYEVDDKNNDNGDDNDNDDDDEADAIIQRSYAKSYAHILPCDEDRPSGKSCIQKRSTTSTRPTQAGIIPTYHPFHGGFKRCCAIYRPAERTDSGTIFLRPSLLLTFVPLARLPRPNGGGYFAS